MSPGYPAGAWLVGWLVGWGSKQKFQRKSVGMKALTGKRIRESVLIRGHKESVFATNWEMSIGSLDMCDMCGM